MSGGRFIIDDAALHAYVDRRLGEADRLAVERFLANHPDKAAEVEAWRQQNAAINALFAPAANEPVPSRLKPRRIMAEQVARSSERRRVAAAAVVLLLIGGSVGWFGRDALTPAEAASDRLIDSALIAHSLYINEKRHAVEVGASDKDHLVTWLSSRLGTAIDAPDLTAQGFALVGGRLLPPDAYVQGGPAAQLMYENASADRLTVYVTSALPDRADEYKYEKRDALEAIYWSNALVTCTVVGDLSDEEMHVVGKRIFTQLTLRPDGA